MYQSRQLTKVTFMACRAYVCDKFFRSWLGAIWHEPVLKDLHSEEAIKLVSNADGNFIFLTDNGRKGWSTALALGVALWMQHAFHQNTRQARSMHNCLKCWPCCLETKAGLTVKCTVVIVYGASEDLLITYFSHKHSKNSNAFLLSLLPFSQLNLLSQKLRENLQSSRAPLILKSSFVISWGWEAPCW